MENIILKKINVNEKWKRIREGGGKLQWKEKLKIEIEK